MLHVKLGARVMLTTNIDVSDGLTNGTVGAVKYVITEEITKGVKVILVEFDNRDVRQEAKSKSLYKHINSKAVSICKTQAIFPVHGKTSCQASQTQFPLVLAWAITIHKCQGLTLPEIGLCNLISYILLTTQESKFMFHSMQKRRWRGYAKIPYHQWQNVFLT